jgi:hypothetical protein
VGGSERGECLINGLAELNGVSNGVGPRFAVPGFVLLNWILFSNFFSNSRELSEPCQTPHKASPAEVNKRMRSLLIEVVKHEYRVFIDRIFDIPIQGS